MERQGKVTLRISRYIQKNIQNGTWKVGDKIPSENQFCQELNVSRVSVRSALKQFIVLGILRSEHGKGTFLVSDDLSLFASGGNTGKETHLQENVTTMRDMLEFRCLIEPSICEEAAANPSPELLAELEALLKAMRNSIGKSKHFVQADMDFHMALCRATGNPVVIEVMESLLTKHMELHLMVNLANGYYGGVYYHTLLLDSIKKHDSKHAYALMLEHLRRGIDDLEMDNSSVTLGPV